MNRQKHRVAAALAAGAFAFAVTARPASAQEPAGRITVIELTPHIAVNDAAARVEAQDYVGAIELLDTFLANEPAPPPEAFYLLGLAHYQLGDYAKARPFAERAATMAGNPPASWLELVADVLKRSDEHRAAIPWLERLVEQAPDNKIYWLELSLAYEKSNDLDRALATMRLAHSAALLTDDADLRRLADLLLNRGLPQQSAQVLEEALAARTVEADEAAYTKLGTAWFTAGELDKAVLPLESAARAADSGDAYIRLAVVHIAREDWASAIAALHAGMGRGSLTDAARANLLMGVALYARGNFDEAREWFTMAEESPEHREAANGYLEAIAARTTVHVPPVR
jgi:tetratricopeptide (TPR) repeat protein